MRRDELTIDKNKPNERTESGSLIDGIRLIEDTEERMDDGCLALGEECRYRETWTPFFFENRFIFYIFNYLWPIFKILVPNLSQTMVLSLLRLKFV